MRTGKCLKLYIESKGHNKYKYYLMLTNVHCILNFLNLNLNLAPFSLKIYESQMSNV